MRKLAFVAATLIVFLALNAMILQKESLKSSGQLMFLKLNDTNAGYQYSATMFYLKYDLVSNLNGLVKGDGCLVVTLDAKNVASFVRVHGDESLASGEHLLRYHRYHEDYGMVQIGPQSYEFSKNQPQLTSAAAYSEFRVSANGDCLFIGICDDKFRRLDDTNLPRRK